MTNGKEKPMTHTVEILVEKRMYRPAGWKNLRTYIAECRLTPKRIYWCKEPVQPRLALSTV